uniref:Uncharacterized protein n=2 Tax=Candidatus Kentrum sp. TUN TaxID=2126343 RepID=A0A450ZJ24_9GAMM|nr:MAG: hypothetical protein BECKTUN1418F_GA0071002_102813 [Candidatus Kentron sp. TUN]
MDQRAGILQPENPKPAFLSPIAAMREGDLSLPGIIIAANTVLIYRYRKNKNFGESVRVPETHPLSALARSANMFLMSRLDSRLSLSLNFLRYTFS